MKLKELELGPALHKDFPFQHKKLSGEVVEVNVKIRVLHPEETLAARVNARRTVLRLDSALTEGRDYNELLEDAKVHEVLAIALRDPEKPEEPWASPVEVRTILNEVETALLWTAYLDWQATVGPIITELSVPEYEGFLTAVASEVESDPLSFFAPPLRRNFTRTMACQLLELRMANALLSSRLKEKEEGESLSSDPDDVEFDENGNRIVDEPESDAERAFKALVSLVSAEVKRSLHT